MTTMGRETRIYQEAAALWRQLYGGPPPQCADASTLLDLIMQRLPEASYQRLATPHLRAATIAMPKA
jgi:hypothetical protein